MDDLVTHHWLNICDTLPLDKTHDKVVALTPLTVSWLHSCSGVAYSMCQQHNTKRWLFSRLGDSVDLAVKCKQLSVCRTLFFWFRKRSNANNIPLMPTAISRGFLIMCQWLLVIHFYKVSNIPPDTFTRSLHDAASADYIDVCEYLRDWGFKMNCEPVNTYRHYQITTFRRAVKNGDLRMCRYFCDCGFEIPNDIMTSVFNDAAENGHVDVCRLLRDALHVKMYYIPYQGPVQLAAKNGHVNVLQFLMDWVEIRNEQEYRITLTYIQWNDNEAFRKASAGGHLSVCLFLKEHCGLTIQDARARNNEAFFAAIKNGHTDVCQFLQEWGV